MRVLHLRSSGGFYGAENVIWQLARKHQGQGVVLSYVASFVDETGDNELLRRCRQDGIPALPVPCRGVIDIKALGYIRQIIRNQDIQVLHTHDYKSTILGLIACTGLNIRKIATNHAWDVIDKKLWLYQRLEGLCYNSLDSIVAVSDSVKFYVEPFLLKKQKLSVIANGIDCQYFASNDESKHVRKELGISLNDFVLGLVGRFSLQKGHQYMLETLQILVQHYPHLKCIFWGSGELEEDLRQQVISCGLDQSVIFAGVSSDMPAVYGAIDLLVLPSLSEGLPMTMLEAMAADVPVLATSVGDIPKIIEDGKNGFLIEPQNVTMLVEKIQTVINDKVRLGEVASNGQQVVRAHYSSVKMANEYEEIYEQILL